MNIGGVEVLSNGPDKHTCWLPNARMVDKYNLREKTIIRCLDCNLKWKYIGKPYGYTPYWSPILKWWQLFAYWNGEICGE